MAVVYLFVWLSVFFICLFSWLVFLVGLTLAYLFYCCVFVCLCDFCFVCLLLGFACLFDVRCLLVCLFDSAFVCLHSCLFARLVVCLIALFCLFVLLFACLS